MTRYPLDREPTVTCETCGWTIRNNSECGDLHGEQCFYRGCRGTLEPSSAHFRKFELPALYQRLKVPKVLRKAFL